MSQHSQYWVASGRASGVKPLPNPMCVCEYFERLSGTYIGLKNESYKCTRATWSVKCGTNNDQVHFIYDTFDLFKVRIWPAFSSFHQLTFTSFSFTSLLYSDFTLTHCRRGGKYDLSTSGPFPQPIYCMTHHHPLRESWKKDLTDFCGHMLHKWGWETKFIMMIGVISHETFIDLFFYNTPTHSSILTGAFGSVGHSYSTHTSKCPFYFNKSVKYHIH